MLSIIGTGLVGLGFVSAIYAVICYGILLKTKAEHWGKIAKLSLYISIILHFTALVLLIWAFITNQFQLQYVAQHSNKAMPFFLNISALWAGQEGSLLLWSFLQILIVVLVTRWSKSTNETFNNWTTLILTLIAAFFSAATLFFSNPFIQLSPIPIDGLGLNPLLRHPAMVFHPPLLYIGYVGLAVPFAFSIASLMIGNVKEWLKHVRPWLLMSWLFLGLGIFLGMRWAYEVLGWGGYWGWDPVENAALMPWLTATGLLHAIDMQGRKQGFKIWNFLFAVFSFILVLFGTYTTRSGMVESVHAFAISALGPYFLLMIGLSIMFAIILMLSRRKLFEKISFPQKLFSKKGMTYFTLLIITLITISILLGSFLSTLTNGRSVASVDWFNRVVGPQLAVLVFLMGVCPLPGRIFTSGKFQWDRGITSLIGMILTPLLGYLAGYNRWISLLAFAIAGLAAGSYLGQIGYNVIAHIRQKGLIKGLSNISLAGRYGYGSHLIHLGVVLMAVGVIGTQMYASEQQLSLSQGESFTIEDYTLTYSTVNQEEAKDHLDIWASFFVYRDMSYLTDLEPQIVYYPSYDQLISEPAIYTALGEDLYLVFFGWNNTGTIDISVMLQPLSAFLWAGGLILMLGGILAWWPKNRSTEI